MEEDFEADICPATGAGKRTADSPRNLLMSLTVA
jgi:hypothetical protein